MDLVTKPFLYSSGAWGVCTTYVGCVVVLKVWLAMFWPEEGDGVVGVENRSYLSCCLAFFQIMSEQGPFWLVCYRFWQFLALLGSETLGLGWFCMRMMGVSGGNVDDNHCEIFLGFI